MCVRYVRKISIHHGVLSELLGKIGINMLILMCLYTTSGVLWWLGRIGVNKKPQITGAVQL